MSQSFSDFFKDHVSVIHVTIPEPKTCSCPPGAPVWDCLDCPVHGKEAEAEVEAQARAEQEAEGAWLRASESSAEHCPEWAR